MSGPLRVTENGVRLRAGPGTDYPIMREMLAGTLAVPASDHAWRLVSVDGQTGWVAADYLEVGDDVIVGPDRLTDEIDHLFSFAELWPDIVAAGYEFGFDAEVLAAIMYQESGFRNWRVHFDGTGHGLLGLDDNGMLPDFESWSGLIAGRGDHARSIPPSLQIRYGAFALARYAQRYAGDPYAAARAWHRGPGLMHDARGAQYERLVRAHVATLFGGA